MHPHKKFAFDVGITFIASVVTLPLGFVIQTSKSLKSMAEFFDKTFLKSFRRYLGAGDLGLYRMASTIYGIAMLVAAIGIPTAMIKNLSFCGALPHDPASPVRAYKKALPKKQYR